MNEDLPISSLTNSFLQKIEPVIAKLPKSPKELAKLAKESGDTVQRLACCISLLRMFKSAIPPLVLSASEQLYVDKYNHDFEQRLNLSLSLPEHSITSIFTCAIIAIGPIAAEKYSITPTSNNPFVQCYRYLARLIWFLRCRNAVLVSIRNHNYLGTVNNSLRLVSFPDFTSAAQRAALLTIMRIPEKIGTKLLAYSLPQRYITDSVKSIYNDMKDTLPLEKRDEITLFNSEVDRLLNSLTNNSFFGSSISLESSLIANLTCDISTLGSDPLPRLMQYFICEVSDDPEFQKCMKELLKVSKKASLIELNVARKRFDFIHVVDVDVPPDGVPIIARAPVDPIKERKKMKNDKFLSIFKTSRVPI